MTEPNPNSSPDDLVIEIERIRDRLGLTIDELLDRSHPKNIAAKQANRIKARFVDESGHPRFENIVPPVVIGVAAVAGIVVLRRLLK